MGSRGQRSASATAGGGSVGSGGGVVGNAPDLVNENGWEGASPWYSKSEVQKLKEKLTDDEIIEKIAASDGKGMCVSQALAYIGNKSGWDVTDMKIENHDLFAREAYWLKRDGHATEDTDRIFSGIKRGSEWKATLAALNSMEAGKQYYMSAGGHASIVRLNPKTKKAEYLELQGVRDKGWTTADSKGWRNRFGIRKGKRTSCGLDITQSTFITEIENIAGQKQFKNMLEYINTKEY